MQSIFRSLLSVWSVRDVVFVAGSISVVGFLQPVITRAPNTHAHQHAIKRHLYSQHGIGCQLLHVCRLQVACVPRIGAGVNYLPLLPSPCSSSLPGPGHGPGPPIDLGKLKRGCDHGMRRTLCVSLDR